MVKTFRARKILCVYFDLTDPGKFFWGAPMASWKRRLVDAVTKPLGVVLVPKGMAWKTIEPEQLERFLTVFEIDCVFDVGANIGQYATQLREIGFKGLIVSFEPNPAAVQVLRDAAAGDDRWIVEELALDEQSRPLTFNVMKSPQFSSLHEPDHSNVKTFVELNAVERRVDVITQTLANVFPALLAQHQFRRPFLKMDTQGHDAAVAKGAGPYLRQFVGLQSELALTNLYRDQPSFVEALDFYKSAGFKLSALVPNNAGHFPDLNEVDCIMYNPGFVPDRYRSAAQPD
jgi:FkbM family methyltransferase